MFQQLERRLAVEVKCDGTIETFVTLGQGFTTGDTLYRGLRDGEGGIRSP